MSRNEYKNQHGYVYGVKSPEDGMYVYVGVSTEPWKAIARLCTDRKTCPAFYDWVLSIGKKYRSFEILDQIVVYRYEDIKSGVDEDSAASLPPYPKEGTRLEWDVLDYIDPIPLNFESSVITFRRGKSYWTTKLLSEGHPLVNKQSGRPRKVGNNA